MTCIARFACNIEPAFILNNNDSERQFLAKLFMINKPRHHRVKPKNLSVAQTLQFVVHHFFILSLYPPSRLIQYVFL